MAEWRVLGPTAPIPLPLWNSFFANARSLWPLPIFASALLAVYLLFVPKIWAPDIRPAALFALSLIVFLAPGVLLARRLEPQLNVTFLALAFFLSYVTYGSLALLARLLGLGYDAFYVSFVAVTFALLAWPKPARTRLHVHVPSIVTYALVVALTTAYFQFPGLNDQGLFDNNILQSRLMRTFEPSGWDVAAFGLSGVQPRMAANLYHAFYALASEIAGTDPRELTMLIANPFVGIFLFLAMTSLIWELSNRRLTPVICLVAVVFPFAIWHHHGAPAYWYSFRFLNAPTLDKDFSLFVLLPCMTICAWRYLISEASAARRWLAVIAIAGPTLVFTHPVAPVYFLINCGILVATTFRPRRAVRAAVLMATAAALLALTNAFIDPGDTHAFIEALAQLDLAENGDSIHYWGGQYVAPWNDDNSVRTFTDSSLLYLTSRRILMSHAILYSAWFSLAWLALYYAPRLGSPSGLRRHAIDPRHSLTALGTAASASSIILLAREPLSLALAGAAVTLAGVGGLALLGATFIDRSPQELDTADPEGESRLLRLQGFIMATLVAVCAVATVVLQFRIELWRGLERLHWFYFGLFPFAFVTWKLGAIGEMMIGQAWRLARAAAAKLDAVRVARAGSIMVLAITTALVGAVAGAHLDEPFVTELDGSQTSPRYARRLVGNVLAPGEGFVTDSPDGDAFVTIRLEEPERLLGVAHRYHYELWPSYRIKRAELQWSDDGRTWTHASSAEERRGAIFLPGDARPHSWWRFVILESGQRPDVVVGNLRLVNSRLMQVPAPLAVGVWFAAFAAFGWAIRPAVPLDANGKGVILACSAFAALCLDQTVAALTDARTLGGRLGIVSYLDGPHQPSRTRHSADFAATHECGFDTAWRSSWGTDADVILVLYQSVYDSNLGMWPQLAYYRELYTEGHAYQRLGDRFLLYWRGYNEIITGELGERARAFLLSRGVTHIVLNRQTPTHAQLMDAVLADPMLNARVIEGAQAVPECVGALPEAARESIQVIALSPLPTPR